jgi:hypothetical protein
MMNGRKLVVAGLFLMAAAFTGFVIFINFRPRSSGRPGPTRIALANLATAVDVFEVDSGHYPESLDEIAKAWTNSPSPRPAWTNVCCDEWGRPFRFQRKKDGVELRSAGRDGRFDTKDDIWQ